MATPTYPYGYAGKPAGMGTMLTMAQYEQKLTVTNLNPEFWRRTKSMMQAAQVARIPLGIGTGWRIQPTDKGPGFASPGNSNHEGFPANGKAGGAVAADMVPETAWPWMEANAATYGLKTFKTVNNEPWHIQPKEIPNSRNWRRDPWKLQVWPTVMPGVPSGANVFGIYPERNQYGLYPLQPWQTKPGVLVGMRDSDIKNTGHIWYAQAVLCYKMNQPAVRLDGFWGNACALYFASKIMDWNKFTGDKIPVNGGAIGQDQWRFIDAYAKDFH